MYERNFFRVFIPLPLINFPPRQNSKRLHSRWLIVFLEIQGHSTSITFDWSPYLIFSLQILYGKCSGFALFQKYWHLRRMKDPLLHILHKERVIPCWNRIILFWPSNNIYELEIGFRYHLNFINDANFFPIYLSPPTFASIVFSVDEVIMATRIHRTNFRTD